MSDDDCVRLWQAFQFTLKTSTPSAILVLGHHKTPHDPWSLRDTASPNLNDRQRAQIMHDFVARLPDEILDCYVDY